MIQAHKHYVLSLGKIIDLQQEQEDKLFVIKGAPFTVGITLIDGTQTELPFNNLQETKTYLNILTRMTHDVTYP